MNSNIWSINIKVRLAGESTFNLFYWMYFPFIAIYFSEQLGYVLVGLLMTVPPVVSLIGGLIGGLLADSIGRKQTMLAGTAVQLICFLTFALVSSVWIEYVAFLGISFGLGLYKPAADAMVADTVPDTNRKEVFATFLTGSNIGTVLGPVIGSTLFFHYKTILLMICSVVVALYFLFILLFCNETMIDSTEVKSKSQIQGKSSYMTILKDRNFLLYIIAGIFSVIAIMQLDLYLSVYIYKEVPPQTLFIDWTSTNILGIMLGLNGLLFVFFVLPVTKWLKNWKDVQVFKLSCLLAGVGMFAVGFTTNLVVLIFLTFIFTFGEIVRAPVLYNFVSEHAPVHARGQYMAASNFQFTIGRFIAPITLFLGGFFTSFAVFSFILICSLVSLILYNLLYKEEIATS